MIQMKMPGNHLIFRYLCLFLFVLLGTLSIIGSAGGGPGEVVTYGGYILLEDDSPLEGIEVTFFWPDPPNIESDGILTVFTDEEGWYSMELTTFSPPSDFTVTPSHPDYDFSPESYSFTRITDDQTDLDFVAAPKT